MSETSDRRRARVEKLHDEANKREARELEKIKQKLRQVPPGQQTVLWDTEALILLRALENNTKLGKPALLAEHHRCIAVHYWWLCTRGTTQLDAEEDVAELWGVKASSVKKYAREFKKGASQTVAVFLADASSAPEHNIALWARAFRQISRK